MTILRTGLLSIIVIAGAWIPGRALAQQTPTADAAPTAAQPELAPPLPDGYVDEPPLDFYERQWRFFTRNARPQRFQRRDLRRRFGYSPPFNPGFYGPPGFGGFGWYDGLGGFGNGYVQGRHDQRRFAQWERRNDMNGRVYRQAMTDGIRLFKETEYEAALQAFVRAARMNQGDPASRVHATYALVALGNYDSAVLMIRRAFQLQSKLIHLPLHIPDEYGPRVDFQAHLQRLEETARAHPDDAGLWMLLGVYHYYSGNRANAGKAFAEARDIAPQDTIIHDLDTAARLYAPSHPRE